MITWNISDLIPPPALLMPASIWTRKDIQSFKDSVKHCQENVIKIGSLATATVSSIQTFDWCITCMGLFFKFFYFFFFFGKVTSLQNELDIKLLGFFYLWNYSMVLVWIIVHTVIDRKWLFLLKYLNFFFHVCYVHMKNEQISVHLCNIFMIFYECCFSMIYPKKTHLLSKKTFIRKVQRLFLSFRKFVNFLKTCWFL